MHIKMLLVSMFCIFMLQIPFAYSQAPFVPDQITNMDLRISYETFLKDLQRAVSENQKEWIADHISYPLCCFHENPIENKQQFLARYSDIFNDGVRKAVLSQKPEDIFMNSNGLMIGSGHVWFIQTLEDAQNTEITHWIITVNNDAN